MRGLSLIYIPVPGRYYLVMTQSDYILQFLRSPTWRAHTIRTAEEAYIDLLACPESDRPTTAIALAERWHLSRPTASKLISEMQKKDFIDSQNHLITDVKTFDIDVKEFDTDVKSFDTPPSRVNEDNINALSDDKAEREKGVRVREAEGENPPKNRSKAFRRPTPDEVQTYLQQLGETSFDGHEFCDYYEQCGWVIGRDRKPMKDWRAAVRTWRRNRSKQSNNLNNLSNPNNAPVHHFHPSTREAERQQRAQAFAQHISNLMADPTGELTPDLDF